MAKPLLELFIEAKQEDKTKSLGYFAERTGIDKGYLSRVVRGVVKSKDPELFKKVAKELHIKPEDIDEYNELIAKKAIDKDPKLAEALAVYNIRAATARLIDLPEEDRRQVEEDIERRLKELRKR